MQEKYIQARLSGENKFQAGKIAGYAKGSCNNMEQPGHPVYERIREKCIQRGLDDDKLIDEYLEGITLAKIPDYNGRRDLNAHAQYLKQSGYLLGYTKWAQQGAVNVQINNNSRKVQINAINGIGELGEEVNLLLGIVRSEIEARKSDQLPGGDSGVADSKAYIDMDSTVTDSQNAGSGGQP